MGWRWQFELMNPCDILERKQERELRRREQSERARRERDEKEFYALFGEVMTQDESMQVEELLQVWFDYEDSYRPALGAPRVSPSCRGHDTGRVHDTDDDRDAKLNKITAEAVGACVDELHYLQRAAIGVHFRNKRVGVSVHRNPRLGSFEEMHEKYQEAKLALWPKLKRKGLVR